MYLVVDNEYVRGKGTYFVFYQSMWTMHGDAMLILHS